MALLAARRERAVKCESIAAELQIPRSYLSKLLSDLVRARLVKARRGPNGGFLSDRAPEWITLLEVLKAVDPIERIDRCPLGNPPHIESCPLHRRVECAVQNLVTSFAATRLHELIDPTLRVEPAQGIDLPPVQSSNR
jgi:Rrf2 family protein